MFIHGYGEMTVVYICPYLLNSESQTSAFLYEPKNAQVSDVANGPLDEFNGI